MTDEKKLPRKIKVGDKWYSVEIAETLNRRGHIGEIDYDAQRIRIVTKRYPLMQETFWHELTHAILEGMGEHRLNNNEPFVEEFSSRLYRAIKSARFQ
jgi:hypothetical protein